MVSENTIFFYSGRGGHSHDGQNSSFIDTSKYSLFDFSWGLLGDPDRQASQDRNYNSFKDFIINTVNQSILNPAGLVLQPGIVNGTAHIVSRSLTTELIAANAITANEILANTITANEIAANAVTANELAANLVLVNNIIRSNNFDGNVAANGAITSAGTAGWAVSGHGQAVFDTTFIRGSLEASSVSTGGVDIFSNGTLIANTFALYGNGAIETSSGNFSVDASGNLFANNADISGEINATDGSIAGWIIGADTISASGGEIALYQELGYGAVIAGTGAGTQIILNSEAQLHAEFGGVDTDINFQTDSAYVFRITDGSNIVRISPSLISASVGASFSYLANDEIVTTGEVTMNTGYVNGIGIAYPGCTTGPGSFNYMGLVWDNPNIRGTVDNVVSAVLGTVSDIRSKANIVNAPSDWALKTLNDLRVVEYNPINILNPDDKTEKPKRLGLIAQELADVFPELVTSVNADDPDAILSVDYLGLVPHLIQVIKLLNDKIESIEQRIGE